MYTVHYAQSFFNRFFQLLKFIDHLIQIQNICLI